MEQQHRTDLLKVMGILYETPSAIDEHWVTVSPLLVELTETSPHGLEGMAMMICKHFTNAAKFKDIKVQKFELESGLIKLSAYFHKLSSFERRQV